MSNLSLSAVTHDSVTSMAKWIVNSDFRKDHACAECEGAMISQGFVCGYHLAKKHLASGIASNDAAHERDLLADAIRHAAIKSKTTNADVPLTGPHLLMLCEDMAEIIVSTSIAHGALVEVLQANEAFWSMRERELGTLSPEAHTLRTLNMAALTNAGAEPIDSKVTFDYQAEIARLVKLNTDLHANEKRLINELYESNERLIAVAIQSAPEVPTEEYLLTAAAEIAAHLMGQPHEDDVKLVVALLRQRFKSALQKAANESNVLSVDDEFNMKRLRRVAVTLGLGASIPESDYALLACTGSVLGMISRTIEAEPAFAHIIIDNRAVLSLRTEVKDSE